MQSIDSIQLNQSIQFDSCQSNQFHSILSVPSQAEKLAVHVLERDEARATAERLRQQLSVLQDRVGALTSDLAIRDEDARQNKTQLDNLGAAMQRLEIEVGSRLVGAWVGTSTSIDDE